MRIRLPFAGERTISCNVRFATPPLTPPPGGFFLLLLVAGYAGLSSLHIDSVVNDKVLHAVTFFLLTVAFYWIADTSRRRTLNMALLVCTAGLGVGSEVLQALIPNNGRVFDLLDIAANILGSLAALGLCSWYHKRMLDRKRHRRYASLPGEEGGAAGGDLEAGPDGPDTVDHQHDEDDSGIMVDGDVELSEGVGRRESAAAAGESAAPAADTSKPAAVSAAAAPATSPAKTPRAATLDEELDNWDENAEDAWEEEDDAGDIGVGGSSTPAKKRTD